VTASSGSEQVSIGMRVVAAATLSSLLFLALSIAPASAATEAVPAPSCAEGPARVGPEIVGTPCSDLILAPPSVTTVKGGGGNDTIVGTPIAATSSCPSGCRLGVGSQTFEGGPGDDVVFGERGNDTLRGGEGNDRLYGGIGDDLLQGGPGNDVLSGGFGADAIDGGPGNDFVRGDGTQDEIVDSGPPSDVDTLSYATGVTPGFGNGAGCATASHAGFPPAAAERGVCLDLSAGGENGNDGGAPNGGGVDSVAGSDFERIVGSPFADYIVGSKPGQQIFGGAGGDVLVSGGVGTSLNGGAGGDDCVGEASDSGCESTAASGPVAQRDPSKVSVGEMTPGEGPVAELYLLGSSGADEVTVSTSGTSPGETVKFQLGGGSAFDQSASESAGCTTPTATEALCALSTPLDSVLVAGLGGDDALTASGLPSTTSLMLLGGEGDDQLTGGDESDDTLVDGPGNDVLHGLGGDDALLNNQGRDQLFGEGGNDLFLSTAICEGDLIEGGEGRDNASWAKFTEGIEARLDQGIAGRPGPGGAVQCSGGTPDSLVGIEDLEGTGAADVLYGDAGSNQLLGHSGPDTYLAGGGEDSILANSADSDPVIDCGEGIDSAIIDIPHPGEYEDATPVNCETVREAAPNDFRTATELPPPLKPVAATRKRPLDRKPPRTRIVHGPAKLLTAQGGRRRVIFRFASSERGSHFRCKLDARPYRPCASPRTYVVAPGKHVVRIDAIDPSGNADPTPATFRFKVRRR
jgi:Ca2+-binding RTX toxin-like protein